VEVPPFVNEQIIMLSSFTSHYHEDYTTSNIHTSNIQIIMLSSFTSHYHHLYMYFTLIYCYLYVVFSVHVIAKTLNNVKAQALSFL
jgi:hypothetical protein